MMAKDRRQCNDALEVGHGSIASRGPATIGATFVQTPDEIDLSGLLGGLQAESRVNDEGELRFRQMAECLPGILWLAEAVTGFIDFVSPAFQAVWGYSRESLYADPELWYSCIHPQDRAEVRSRRAARTEFSDVTYRIITVTGEVRWIRCRRSPVFDSMGVLCRLAGYSEDITATRLLEVSLQRLDQLLREAREEEGRRIARDLHDSTGQNLAGVALALQALDHYVPAGDHRSRALLARSQAALEECGRELSSYTHLLHPPQLTELGLIGALRHFVNGFSERTGIVTSLQLSSALARVPGNIGAAVLRIVQEALGNVKKHSGSAGASVHIEVEDDMVKLQIRDRGRGIPADLFDPDGKGAHLGVGISGMRERVREFGGALRLIRDHPGTTLLATLRLPRPL